MTGLVPAAAVYSTSAGEMQMEHLSAFFITLGGSQYYISRQAWKEEAAFLTDSLDTQLLPLHNKAKLFSFPYLYCMRFVVRSFSYMLIFYCCFVSII